MKDKKYGLVCVSVSTRSSNKGRKKYQIYSLRLILDDLFNLDTHINAYFLSLISLIIYLKKL